MQLIQLQESVQLTEQGAGKACSTESSCREVWRGGDRRTLLTAVVFVSRLSFGEISGGRLQRCIVNIASLE